MYDRESICLEITGMPRIKAGHYEVKSAVCRMECENWAHVECTDSERDTYICDFCREEYIIHRIIY